MSCDAVQNVSTCSMSCDAVQYVVSCRKRLTINIIHLTIKLYVTWRVLYIIAVSVLVNTAVLASPTQLIKLYVMINKTLTLLLPLQASLLSSAS